MKIAVFFQKHTGRISKLLRSIYGKFFLRSNKRRIKYLKDAGAKIGKNVTVGKIDIFGSEPYLIEVGDNTYFSGGDSRLLTHDGGIMQLKHMGITEKGYDYFGKIKIGKNCFIGHNCIVMKNVTIGDNCIIGAGAIVAKSIPTGCVAAGVPAKVICTVEEYYEKNKERYDDTLGWNGYKKRQYIEEHMEKYEKVRKEKEL